MAETEIKVRFGEEGASDTADAVEAVAEAIQSAGEASDEAAGQFAALTRAKRNAEQALGRLSRGLEGATQNMLGLDRATKQQAMDAIALTARVGAVASAVESLTSSLGGGSSGLIGATASSAASMAQLGAAMGPQGAVVGGIVGAFIPAIQAIRTAVTETHERNEAWREQLVEIELAQQRARAELERSTASIDDHSEALRTAAERMRAFVASLTRRGLQTAAEDTSARITELADQLAAVNDQLARGPGVGAAAALRFLELQERARTLRQEIERLSEEAASQREEADANRGRTRGSGPDRLAREQAAWERYEEAIQRGLRQEEEARERVAAAQRRQIELMIEAANKAREQADAVVRAQLDEKAAIERAEAEAHRRGMERMRDQQRRDQELIEANRAAYQRSREQTQQEAELVTAANRSIVNAVQEVIAGTKSADEAFKGMLASFLESVAEQALISAAKEYAEAIAAFARYDFGSGAQHVAAGVAYTGVAIAAGGAAGAMSAPSQGGQPDRPDNARQGGEGDSGRTVYVNNWNAPAVMAGTEADVGRTLGRLGRRATQRYGRLAA